MPDTKVIANALEVAPKVISAVSNTQQVSQTLSTVAHTARQLDGEWIPELVAALPGAKQTFHFFGKVIEKPVTAIAHTTLSYCLKREIKKQLRHAKETLTQNSFVKTAFSSLSTYLPDWAQQATNLVSPLMAQLSESVIDELAAEMLTALDPFVNAPAAAFVGENVSYYAMETAKTYVGHHIQAMVIAYLAEQLQNTEYAHARTAIVYAKQADDYPALMILFVMMLSANLLPYLFQKLFCGSETDRVKTQLKDHILRTSAVDCTGLKGQIYAAALDATLTGLFKSGSLDVNHVRIALASADLATSAVQYPRQPS